MRKDSEHVFVDAIASAQLLRSDFIEVRDESQSHTIQSVITGAGAVSATVNWYGSNIEDYDTGELIGTNTLTGTNKDSTGGGGTGVQWAYVWAEIPANSITGTNAKVNSYLGN